MIIAVDRWISLDNEVSQCDASWRLCHKTVWHPFTSAYITTIHDDSVKFWYKTHIFIFMTNHNMLLNMSKFFSALSLVALRYFGSEVLDATSFFFSHNGWGVRSLRIYENKRDNRKPNSEMNEEKVMYQRLDCMVDSSFLNELPV